MTSSGTRRRAAGRREENEKGWGAAGQRCRLGCDREHRTFPLPSYDSQGATWVASGTQSFLDRTTLTLTAQNRTGVLEAAGTKCFGSANLYHGTTVCDGGTGAAHSYVPLYPDIEVVDLIAGHAGGKDCVPPVNPVRGATGRPV